MTKITDDLAERGVEVLKRIAFSTLSLDDASFIAGWVHDARNALRAKGEVRVKPLEWRKSNIPNRWMAETCWGEEYKIIREAMTLESIKPYRWFNRGTWVLEATLEEAKAAAQADYERRILSSLEASPMTNDKALGEAEVVAWRVPAWNTSYGQTGWQFLHRPDAGRELDVDECAKFEGDMAEAIPLVTLASFQAVQARAEKVERERDEWKLIADLSAWADGLDNPAHPYVNTIISRMCQLEAALEQIDEMLPNPKLPLTHAIKDITTTALTGGSNV